MSFLDGLVDRLFPADKHPGVGILGRVFLDGVSPKPERRLLLPPSGTGIGRKRKDDRAVYAPPITREHAPWPHQSWPGGQQSYSHGRTGSGRGVVAGEPIPQAVR